MTEPSKRCTGPDCGLVKPLSAFSPRSNVRDGRMSWCLDCMAAAARVRYEADRVAVFGHYGTSCACCAATEPLTIDHVNGGGGEHRRRLRVRSAGFYAWLIRQGFPPGYQTMCMPCNRSKSNGSACRLWHGDPSKKRCLGPCDRVLDLDQFYYRQAGGRGGRRSRCRDCMLGRPDAR